MVVASEIWFVLWSGGPFFRNTIQGIHLLLPFSSVAQYDDVCGMEEALPHFHRNVKIGTKGGHIHEFQHALRVSAL
jgi:hypothetical protein